MHRVAQNEPKVERRAKSVTARWDNPRAVKLVLNPTGPRSLQFVSLQFVG
jgi:hypothetical protein